MMLDTTSKVKLEIECGRCKTTQFLSLNCLRQLLRCPSCRSEIEGNALRKQVLETANTHLQNQELNRGLDLLTAALAEDERFIEARFCLAKSYLEAHFLEAQVEDAKKHGMSHVEILLEDQDEVSTDDLQELAQSLGWVDEKERGLAILEDLYHRGSSEEMISEIASYREIFKLGTLWQVRNDESAPVIESTTLGEIADRFCDGTLVATAEYRTNRVGEFQPVVETLAEDEFRIGVLFHPVKAHAKKGAEIGGGAVGCLGMLGMLGVIAEVGLLGYIAIVPAVVIGLLVIGALGMGVGYLVGLVVGALRRRRPVVKSV